MQDVSGVGPLTVGKFLVPILGSWHPYKHASAVVFRCLYNFTAPLFHHFHPGNNIFLTMGKLTKVTYWLSLIRLSFPQWSGELAVLMADKSWRNKNKVNQELFTHLSNLSLAVRYFIPLVSAHIGTHH
jgi:hypothetical protein